MKRGVLVTVVILMAVLASTMVFAGGRSGQEVYEQICFGCHDSGMMDAPIAFTSEFRNREKAKGFDKLFDNAMKGFGDMPPNGSCSQCTAEEIKAALKFMLGSGK